jgi:hypothetical protein
MRRYRVSAILLAAAIIVNGGYAIEGWPTANAATTAMGWGVAQAVRLPYTGAGAGGNINGLSCSGPGSCVAVGWYNTSSSSNAFILEEKNGRWGAVRAVPGLAALDGGESATLSGVSCASPGNCTAGGSFNVPAGEDAFAVSEVKGTWRNAIVIPGIAAISSGNFLLSGVDAVSCAAAGSCSITGFYTPSSDSRTPFAASEVNGTWSPATAVAGQAAANGGDALGISCGTPGNCAAYGGEWLAAQTRGTWRAAAQTPVPQLYSIACAGTGYCLAVGRDEAGSAAFTVWASGHWSPARHLPGMAGLPYGSLGSEITAVACTAPGDCTVAGNNAPLLTKDPEGYTFIATESNGAWQPPRAITGFAYNNNDQAMATALSCPVAGSCAVAISYWHSASNTFNGFVATQTQGTWGQAQPLRAPASLARLGVQPGLISCARSGFCSAAGEAGAVPFVVTMVPLPATSTAAALSASRTSYGNEQSVRVSVAVGAASGTPTGTVTVGSGRVAACVITLKAGGGSCALPATRLAAGTIRLTARYGGSPVFAPSAYLTTPLVVTRASTTTAARLSAGSVRYGDEQAEAITVTVRPRYAGPAPGSVAVRAGTVTVCTISLHHGTGRCTMSRKRLAAGTYHLSARYDGSADYAESVSARLTLTITG